MIVHELIEKIEGEASVDYTTEKGGKVLNANIRFPHFRGMETILEGRHALDALVITPRVCGICGHSHLQASARMLENFYRSQGITFTLSTKAETIREITRMTEVIQNHIKWFYLIMLNESSRLLGNSVGAPLKPLKVCAAVNRLGALFSGQWPHSSYAIPGGVTCDPTYVEVMQAKAILGEIEQFVFYEMAGENVQKGEGEDIELTVPKGDFQQLLRNIEKLGLNDTGRGYDRFIVLGEHSLDPSGILEEGKLLAALADKVIEDAPCVEESQKVNYARKVSYAGNYYETGPLARELARQSPFIENLYHKYGDSVAPRVSARMSELLLLTKRLRKFIETLDLSGPSVCGLPDIASLSGKGVGIVEAPRGSLIHQSTIENGMITEYSIITPTQWNLANGESRTPGVAQKAMIGAASTAKATFIFRTFDVCSVCTTQ